MPREADRVARELEGFTTRAARQLLQAVSDNLQVTTPVLTGFARSNWYPSVGAPEPETLGTRELAELGSLQDSFRRRRVAEVVATYTLDQGSIYLQNNVTYVPLLNDGSSRKAPAGFIEQSVAQAAADVERRLRPLPGAFA